MKNSVGDQRVKAFKIFQSSICLINSQHSGLQLKKIAKNKQCVQGSKRLQIFFRKEKKTLKIPLDPLGFEIQKKNSLIKIMKNTHSLIFEIRG